MTNIYYVKGQSNSGATGWAMAHLCTLDRYGTYYHVLTITGMSDYHELHHIPI